VTELNLLRALVEASGDASTLTVPTSWVRSLLSVTSGAPEPVDVGVVVDLSAEQLAAAMGRDPSVIRAWCRDRRFPGAYKLLKKQWRIPRSAVEAFQKQQRERYEG
jgi:hypothetical protein